MANPEQLELLKSGVTTWNKWHKKHSDTEIDLRKADLNGAHLRGAVLKGANLSEANLNSANLSETNLSGANLSKAKLWEAKLWEANLKNANLKNANLRNANLRNADLRNANLRNSNLSQALLYYANLSEADISEANLSRASLANTSFGNIDLSQAIGLETVHHLAPSTIGTATLQLFKGEIPETFLRGCGMNDVEIESAKLANPNLTNEEINKIVYRIYDLRATQSIQISPLFISYSHVDSDFVNQIDSALTKKGIRFWRDIHDAKAGRLETQIDLAIRQNPTVLLVLSKNSLNSDWVQHEVRKARELEKQLERDSLCPIALDDSWKSNKWPARIVEQVLEYNILDFSGWEDSTTFKSKFAKLLSGLDLFYKKPSI